MINDPELKAMSEVYDALSGLSADTQKRVVDWVTTKLSSSSSVASKGTGAKRGRKPGAKAAAKKRTGAKRGRKPGVKAAAKKNTGAKRGPKPGKKRGPKPGKKRGPKPGKKRGPKPGATKNVAAVAKKTGKRGRPAGSGKKAVAKTTGRRKGRPRKSTTNTAGPMASA